VTGQTFHDALENGVSEVESPEGRFPQVSGMEFAWDPESEAGDRVDPGDVTVGGDSLDLEATYTLGTNNSMADGVDLDYPDHWFPRRKQYVASGGRRTHDRCAIGP